MSAPRWTPTEWTPHKDPTLGAPERWCVYANEAPIGQRMPAECTGPHARWNATLIAAAPDGYALAARLVKFFGDVPPEELPLMIAEDPSVLTGLVSDARAFIAKAEDRPSSLGPAPKDSK